MGGQIPRARRDTAQMLDPHYVGRIMPGKPVIARELKKAGYTTAHVGKWHVAGPAGYPSPIQLGFDFSFDEQKKYKDPEIYDAKDPKQANFSGLFAQPKDRLKDAFTDPRFPLLDDDRPYDSMVDLSQRWIGKVARGDKPFFLNLCPSLVHGPIMTRDRKRLAHYCEKLGIPFPTDPGSISDPDKPGQPYYNTAYKGGDLPSQKQIPAVTGRGSKGARIWTTFETGDDKAKVAEVFLLYTINPGGEEEWFRVPAELTDGKAVCTAPPGMTHGVFCLIDENNFLIHGEPIPLMTEYRLGQPISAKLKDGFAYRPGLLSLVEVAESAMQDPTGKSPELKIAIQAAKATCQKPVDEKLYSTAIDRLRREIRMPSAQADCLNYFPIGK